MRAVGLLLWEGEPGDRATEVLGDAVVAAPSVAGLLHHGHAINTRSEDNRLGAENGADQLVTALPVK